MATITRYPQGHQFFDNETPAVPLAGGKLYFYEAGTLTHQTTYSDSDGLVANTVNGSNAIVLDAQGRLEEAVYLGDAGPYKEELTDADDVTLDPWPEDDIPAAAAEALEGSARAPYSQWINIDDSDSPLTLTADDIGKAYAVDTTNGSVTINLPAVATVGVTGGFIFKKVVSGNSMIIAPSGTDEIEDNNGNVTVAAPQAAIGVFSANTEWRIPFKFAPMPDDINKLTAASILPTGGEMMLQLTGGGAFRKIAVDDLFAVAAEMEAGTELLVAVPPGLQHRHPGHPKFWGYATVSGGVPTLRTSFNVTSISDTGTGQLTVTIATDFSGVNWAPFGHAGTDGGSGLRGTQVSTQAAGSCRLDCVNTTPNFQDPESWSFFGLGDQA